MSYFCGFNNLLMYIFSIFLFFILFFNGITIAEHENPLLDLFSREEMVHIAGYGEEKLSTVIVTGSVHCETCHLHDTQLHALPLPGTLVGVDCSINGKKSKASWAHGVTDEFGDFIVELPSNLHAIPNLENICSVKVLQIPKNPSCRPVHVRKHKRLRLSSIGNGIRTYDAGKIKFWHFTSTSTKRCTRKGRNKKNMLSKMTI